MKCGVCGTEKTKYMGSINGTPAVMYRSNCSCSGIIKGRTDKQLEEHISTPFWQHMGLPPTPKEKAQLRYLKENNMSWSDMRRKRNYKASEPNAIKQVLNKEVKTETPKFEKSS